MPDDTDHSSRCSGHGRHALYRRRCAVRGAAVPVASGAHHRALPARADGLRAACAGRGPATGDRCPPEPAGALGGSASRPASACRQRRRYRRSASSFQRMKPSAGSARWALPAPRPTSSHDGPPTSTRWPGSRRGGSGSPPGPLFQRPSPARRPVHSSSGSKSCGARWCACRGRGWTDTLRGRRRRAAVAVAPAPRNRKTLQLQE